MKKFLSLSGELCTEKVIERSRFITTSGYVESEDAARAFVKKITERFKDATHNCYAYVADHAGNILRFSDDGEPSKTAGMPILDVIRGKKLFCAAVVVTRYFGGIKLGAGGLVRAYSGCAAENLDAAKKMIYMPCVESEYAVGYENADACTQFFARNDCLVNGTNYSDSVAFIVAVKSELSSSFDSRLTERLGGKISIKRLGERYFGFEI